AGECVIPNTAVLTGSMEGSRCFATREPARAARRGNTLLLPAQPQGSYPRRRQVVAGVGVAPFFIFRRFLMFFSVGRGGRQRAGSDQSRERRPTTRRATPRFRPELLPLEDRRLLSPVTVLVGPGGANTFSPAAVTVNVGDTVHWVWNSDFHSTTSGPCSG